MKLWRSSGSGSVMKRKMGQQLEICLFLRSWTRPHLSKASKDDHCSDITVLNKGLVHSLWWFVWEDKRNPENLMLAQKNLLYKVDGKRRISWFQLLRVCICLLILQCLTTIFSQLNWLGLNLSRSRFCLGLDTLRSWSWLGLTLDVGRLFCILCLRFRTDTLLCITTETLIRLFFFFAASLDIHCIVICQSNASPPLEQNRTVRDKNVHIQIDNSRRNATAFILASFLQHDGSFRLRLISTGIIESNQVNECLIGNALLRAV